MGRRREDTRWLGVEGGAAIGCAQAWAAASDDNVDRESDVWRNRATPTEKVLRGEQKVCGKEKE